MIWGEKNVPLPHHFHCALLRLHIAINPPFSYFSFDALCKYAVCLQRLYTVSCVKGIGIEMTVNVLMEYMCNVIIHSP